MMMRRADANHDGKISRAEFLNQPMRMFDRFDTNHDGRLDAQEQQAMRDAMASRMAQRGQ